MRTLFQRFFSSLLDETWTEFVNANIMITRSVLRHQFTYSSEAIHNTSVADDEPCVLDRLCSLAPSVATSERRTAIQRVL